MNYSYYIFLHGNPGSPLDFDPLIKDLNLQNAQVLMPDLMTSTDSIAIVLKTIKSVKADQKISVTIIAYSWGAYLACKLIADNNFNQIAICSKLVLVSPYMKNESKLSAFGKFLFKIWGFNWLLAGVLKSKLKKSFLSKSFGLQQDIIPQHNHQILSKSRTWLKAVDNKNRQEENPISLIIDIPTLVIYSKDDSAMKTVDQLSVVETYCSNHTTVHWFAGNHALIQTRHHDVAEEIKLFTNQNTL